MGWVRMSDDFYDNDKMLAAGSIGRDLYWHGMAYCNRNLTDGLIPRGKARGLVDFTGAAWLTGNMSGVDGDECAPYAINNLIDSDLWHEDGHDCPECVQPGRRHYVVHDYLKYQPSRAEVEESARQKRERTRKWREKKDAEREDASCDASRDAPVTDQVSARPTPTPTPTPSTSLVETSRGRVTKATARESQTPRPQCPKHDENHDGPCRACKLGREWDEAHEADELNRKRTQRQELVNTVRSCPECDEYGRTVNDDGDITGFCERHPRLKDAANA